MLEAEVYRIGFCRFIRPVWQSLRSLRLSESTVTDQSEQIRAIRFWPLLATDSHALCWAVTRWLTDNRPLERRACRGAGFTRTSTSLPPS